MKTQLFALSRKVAWTTVFAAGLFALSARADSWDKKTIITIDQPMQITDTLLQPGSYMLRLYDSNADRHVVQIWNADGRHMINTVLAIPKINLEASGKSQFTFWETPPGNAKALRAWFYPGDTTGNEFAYPKHPQQIAMATPPAAPEVTPTTSDAGGAAVETVPAAPPEPVASAPETQPAEPTVEPQPSADQDQTPAPPPPAMDQGTADRAATPTELPKTGSPYPLIGLCGIALASLGGMLASKRTA
jgi:LPXTG-motif cell wall-anchored protein